MYTRFYTEDDALAARARIRVLVKKILRKYGYPPDLQDSAVQTVLQQAEALSAEWASVV
jgi:type I restriction enzyme, R subunit